jgi:hypothetical protein
MRWYLRMRRLLIVIMLASSIEIKEILKVRLVIFDFSEVCLWDDIMVTTYGMMVRVSEKPVISNMSMTLGRTFLIIMRVE